jgi:hypothetical protein
MKKIDIIFIPVLIVGGFLNRNSSIISSTEPVTLAFQYNESSGKVYVTDIPADNIQVFFWKTDVGGPLNNGTNTQ